MINVDYTNINNAKLIGRLLPFWARGRKISMLLQSILSPIINVHKSFQKWALEKLIECKITAQRPSLEWYLNYKLKLHFKNANISFRIVHGSNIYTACFLDGVWRNNIYWNNELKWSADSEWLTSINQNMTCISTGHWRDEFNWDNSFQWANDGDNDIYNSIYDESNEYTNVYAPQIVDSLDYDLEDYERDIRYILSKYMVNFKPIKIIFNAIG